MSRTVTCDTLRRPSGHDQAVDSLPVAPAVASTSGVCAEPRKSVASPAPSPPPPTHFHEMPPESAPSPLDSIVDGTWLDSCAYRSLCDRAAQARPIRVLGISLFDGIGAFWELFRPWLGSQMQWVGQFSCEVDSDALRVLRHRFHICNIWVLLNSLIMTLCPAF